MYFGTGKEREKSLKINGESGEREREINRTADIYTCRQMETRSTMDKTQKLCQKRIYTLTQFHKLRATHGMHAK